MPTLGLSLFWRTFVMLAVLLFGSIVAWQLIFRAQEFEPRAVQSAHQIASLVNLTRAALVYADAIARVSLIKTLADQEGVRITPREPGDTFVPFAYDSLSARITDELTRTLGPDTVVAYSVNDTPGLWVGFSIDGDAYWLRTDPERIGPAGGRTWLIWLASAAILSLLGAGLMARLINRPLQQLSRAASRVRDGDFAASRLDENVNTTEIREVNVGFNRMAEQLSKIEQDRAVMLAGISHDLRTPLARLRLETELSVADADARAHMAADIEQLDGIIGKFLEYAQPHAVALAPVSLNEVVEASTYAVKDYADMQVRSELPPGLVVLADRVELSRVVSNLLENARRYGKNVDSGIAMVHISARLRDHRVLLTVRDEGSGVAPEVLARLTTPFFRGDAARTAAKGAGLGLAIVDKTIARMGGRFQLANAAGGGLVAQIELQRAKKEHKKPVAGTNYGSNAI